MHRCCFSISAYTAGNAIVDTASDVAIDEGINAVTGQESTTTAGGVAGTFAENFVGDLVTGGLYGKVKKVKKVKQLADAADEVYKKSKFAKKKAQPSLTKESVPGSSKKDAYDSTRDDSVGAMRVKGSKVETDAEIRARLNEKFGRKENLNENINSKAGYNGGVKQTGGYKNQSGYTMQGKPGEQRWKSTQESNKPKYERNQKSGHGNRRDNPNETYWYHIRVDGKARKGGISSGNKKQDGTLSRSSKQVDKIENTDPNAGRVEDVIRKSFPNRDEALKYERSVLDRYKRRYGEYPGQGLPGGNKTNR